MVSFVFGLSSILISKIGRQSVKRKTSGGGGRKQLLMSVFIRKMKFPLLFSLNLLLLIFFLKIRRPVICGIFRGSIIARVRQKKMLFVVKRVIMLPSLNLFVKLILIVRRVIMRVILIVRFKRNSVKFRVPRRFLIVNGQLVFLTLPSNCLSGGLIFLLFSRVVVLLLTIRLTRMTLMTWRLKGQRVIRSWQIFERLSTQKFHRGSPRISEKILSRSILLLFRGRSRRIGKA